MLGILYRVLMNEAKNKIQNEAVTAWSVNKKGRFEMCTGSGKSRAAILSAIKNNCVNICIIVPTENLRDSNWPKELRDWGFNGSADIICYASASKITAKVYDLVILDEIHRITPLSMTFFTNNVVGGVLGLTATLPEDPEKLLLINEIAPCVYSYPLEKGIADGVVSPFEITVLDHMLDSKDKYLEAGTKLKKFMSTEAAQYAYLTKIYNTHLYCGNHRVAQMWAGKRMRLLYDLKSKTDLGIKLLEKGLLDNQRSLIFCGSINQANLVCEHSYHSKSTEDNLKKLKLGEINRLSCIRKLNEGENIHNLDSALVLQCNSKELDLIQRIGRVVRWREGHKAKIWIVRTLNTQDEVWVDKALANFDRTIVPISFQYAKNLIS
jgi:superfamily II DNA or RNA helicase